MRGVTDLQLSISVFPEDRLSTLLSSNINVNVSVLMLLSLVVALKRQLECCEPPSSASVFTICWVGDGTRF